MPRSRGRITERTLYTPLIKLIEKHGWSAWEEARAGATIPDIWVEIDGQTWIFPVKIGQDLGTFKDAFLQYLRHKDEIPNLGGAVLLFFPSDVRQIQPDSLEDYLQNAFIYAVIDAGSVKTEKRITLSNLLNFIEKEILESLRRKETRYYSLDFVISLLQDEVQNLIKEAFPDTLPADVIELLVADKELFEKLTATEKQKLVRRRVLQFLGACILVSQIIFLRFLASERKEFMPYLPITKARFRDAVRKVIKHNWKPIFNIDVIDIIDDDLFKKTFDLIWGLEIERIQHELPGRFFHALMPLEIRKLLAAFYTRPIAAEILAWLAIDDPFITVFDPAVGSGTILVSAYKRKRYLYEQRGYEGNPHKRFCENEIFGVDIMPFAVHLAAASIAAMDVQEEIDRIQIGHADSLSLTRGGIVKTSYYQPFLPFLFSTRPQASPIKGENEEIHLPEEGFDVILMNPPFTKTERKPEKVGINLQKYKDIVGGEVGLWGHFVALATQFLKKGGVVGAVLPINLLRGRESRKVREILFEQCTPFYIIKPSLNYGFSEYAEYRDILVIAKNEKPPKNHKVKFCVIKKDLTSLDENRAQQIAESIKSFHSLRSEMVDIDEVSLSEVYKHFDNLMWFIGTASLDIRDVLISFVQKFSNILNNPPASYFKEGFRPVPRGVSKFLFLTREIDSSRVQESFLRFKNTNEKTDSIIVHTFTGQTKYKVRKEHFYPTLRTAVGISTMDITKQHDYIALESYEELDEILQLSKFIPPERWDWREYWQKVREELKKVKTKIVVVRRINPFAPSTYLSAFFSDEYFSPSNQLNVVCEENEEIAKAFCVIMNSVIFWAQFFVLKEESTGRFIDIRFYDLEQMKLIPTRKVIPCLVEVFNKWKNISFPPLRLQFDTNFDTHYNAFWNSLKSDQQTLPLFKQIQFEPSLERIEFDKDVCKALGLNVTEDDLRKVYEAITKEMIITRGLRKD